MSSSFLELPSPTAKVTDSEILPLLDPLRQGPIRAELLGMERLESQARRLAAACVLGQRQRVNSPLLKQFVENQRVLIHARREILGHDRQEVQGIDADWLADNFHIVDDVLREVRQDLPRGYDVVLPKLGTPPFSGFPRVYALAVTLIAHTDSELDEPKITRFVQAFQEVVPLTIGELWALPTMFRLVLLENLRRLAEQMLRGWEERQRAERWFEQAMAAAESAGIDRSGMLPEARLAPLKEPSGPFVVRLVQLLRDQGPAAAPVLRRLEAALTALGQESDEILGREHHRQAVNQITVGNCVLSLRLLSAVDWNSFFERSSLVEKILREDPAGIYPHQDFATNDRYRKVVEKIARGSKADELTVARQAIELARTGSSQGAAKGHVGYYLVNRGEAALRIAFGYRPDGHERFLDWVLAHPRAVYWGSITLLLGGLLLILLLGATGDSPPVRWFWLALIVLISLLPGSELAVGLVNHLLTLLLPPRVLPKLELKEGIPEEFATFVVMPSMLVRPRSAEVLCERLETHYLANPGTNLHFALLTDFADAPQEEMPEDRALLDDALEQVRALNQRYAADGPELFYLFHRRRLWNPAENCWMGWERKRGKLSEFNRLLRGDHGTTYMVSSSDPAAVPRTRFVITLDADTQMPRDTVRRLVGTMAHPLNQPRFDAGSGRVVEGYGVLQPRVSFHLTAATHSHFAALLAASGGIDPYSSAASDSYMDLFGLGSFIGKGIYDVDAFEAATGETFPENHILSHDLIEGNYARCGLLSDTELFDDFPARYHAYARREHRWVRGDWQLIPWLGRLVPAPHGAQPNPLPALERWKLFDNLRRSLIPPALVVMLVLGWAVLPGSPWLWTTIALGVLALPLVKWFISAVLGCARTLSLASLSSWRNSVPNMAGQTLLAVVFLADQSRLMCDAVVRTLARLLVTRRRLLEWETAASTEQRLGTGLRDFLAGMWGTLALAAASAAVVALMRPSALWAASPFLAGWFLSPVVAFWVSRPKQVRDLMLSEDERRALRRITRKTWLFFETFVGDEDHWLPPDNFQEIPDGRIAHRTSPTNQGMLLLSTLAAHDLGYLGLGRLADRLEKTFDALERMEKHWGHFYNWYDTRTLRPLPPAYISTVDSGNLLGCLLALKQGLIEKTREPVLGLAVAAGLTDTFRLIDESWRRSAARLVQFLQEEPGDLLAWNDWLVRLEREAVELLARISEAASSQDEDVDDSQGWAQALVAQIRERRDELAALAPWLPLFGEPQNKDDQAARPDNAKGYLNSVDGIVTSPRSLDELADRVRATLVRISGRETSRGEDDRAMALAAALQASAASGLRDRLHNLANRAEALGAAMDFRPLYKPERHLYAIGANLGHGNLDGACYDLLASESCLTSYLNVARGDAPRRHWFQLGRPYIHAAGRIGLISWGGTMFEYLMPRLLLRSLPNTLLSEACRTAVARQIEYGQQLGIPWGVSESAFIGKFMDGDYRYQSFGVPGLGLKRGLENDRVVAPYATAMAAMIAPREALANFQRLAGEGAEGKFGFYEAIDYTPDRLPHGQRLAVVRSYMSHHQGMSLVALTNVLLDDPMPRRFHLEPMVRAAELLLQERIPTDSPIVEAAPAWLDLVRAADSGAGSLLSRRLTTPATAAPRTHLLSNTRYHVMITNGGSGSSKCQGLDVTRWREDATCEGWGQFFYVRDAQTGQVWSAGHQPVCRAADDYEVVFSTDKALLRRRDADIETLLEIAVSPEQLAEVRRITLTNHGSQPRELELTSYVEPVLNYHGADLSHPAFGKLFLETEYLPGSDSLLCRRRPRSAQERPIWAVHVMAVDRSAPGCTIVGALQYETDRARFVGRGRTPADPAALSPNTILSGTIGPVLDPVFSLRRGFRVEPAGSAVVGFTLATAESRDSALALADAYHGISAVARAFELAWARSQVEHGHRHGLPEDHLYQRLGSHLLFAGTALRAHSPVLATNRQGQAALARYGIAGDRPILLARIAEGAELSLVSQLLAAREFLRLKGLEFDLVLLVQEESGNTEDLRQQIFNLIRDAGSSDLLNRPGGVFVLPREGIPEDDVLLLEAASRVLLDGARGSLSGQLDRIEWARSHPEPLIPTQSPGRWNDEPVDLPPDLQFFNGLGGFAAEGREYCLLIKAQDAHSGQLNGQPNAQTTPYPVLPPAPWVNVVANPAFGFLVSESGSGFTWAGNSQTNRLTGWSNDPVVDPPSEVVYLRDEATGQTWCPTPLPIPTHDPTRVRHGQGYTIFERKTHGIEHELTLLVPTNDPIKLIQLRVRNSSNEPRQLSATYFAEWTLGACRDATAMHLVTEVDPETDALLARNTFRVDFADRVAFVDVNRRPRTITADRVEFLGRHGSVAAPAALHAVGLSGRTGAGFDPCAAIQTRFNLGPGEATEIVFLLGEAESLGAARDLIRRYWQPDSAARTLHDVTREWDRTHHAVQVTTPDPSFNLVMNRWLLYQVVSCRLWARSAFYQSGGAYGFRDQLQDVMALFHASPDLARAHLLLAASRQFVEGDVQHWWHPPAGRGVRTRSSDDFLWLPYVTALYVRTTADASFLDESVSYLRAPLLEPGQDDDLRLPAIAEKSGPLYEHCTRALERGLRLGAHGLPLIGSGDWNDGMNRVGVKGQGESVWLAWFLIDCLRSFAQIADTRNDNTRSVRYREQADQLSAAIEKHGWDGAWYLRAFFDDGTPLGSAKNRECQIDSIAQSWGVISRAADPQRARKAMESVLDLLIRREEGLILLLTPPFDDGPVDPGYIKGYLPGVRENGAQYTHAATWVVQAIALLGEGRRAFELFQILNPIEHARDPSAVQRYKLEPYVVAGDVFSQPPLAGRGGWSWYTGSAAWLYRAGLESILGLRRSGDRLTLDPCIPPEWKGFEISYQYRSATYRITVENPQGLERGIATIRVDGRSREDGTILLTDDEQSHDVRVFMGNS
ncbi:MAG: glucoamylase family protein [Isosphaeraceae bacterium]